MNDSFFFSDERFKKKAACLSLCAHRRKEMNVCKRNLSVECLLRVDVAIVSENNNNNSVASTAMAATDVDARTVSESLFRQLQLLFGLSAGKIDIFAADDKQQQALATTTLPPVITLLPAFSTARTRRQRDGDDNDGAAPNTVNTSSSSSSSIGTGACAVPAPNAARRKVMHVIFVRSVLERQYVPQLHAVCASIGIVAKRAARITVVGAPRKFVVA